MPFKKLGDFPNKFRNPPKYDAGNLKGNTINAEEIILGGGEKGIIRSQDFVSGSAGWKIDAAGTAEFANADIRGTITATGGTITGTLTVTGTIRTATSGERMEITSNAYLTIYDSSGTVVGYLGYSPTGYGVDELVLATVAGLDNVVIDSDALLTLKAGGSAGVGVTVASSPAGGVPGNPFQVLNSTGSSLYFRVSDRPQTQHPDGSVSFPGISFLNDLDTGLYRAGANDLRLVAGGSSIAQVASTTFGPGTDNAYSLGSSGQRWTAVWAVNGTIQTSDIREKIVLGSMRGLGLDLIRGLTPIRYRWRRGHDTERVHWGFSAQELYELTGDEGAIRTEDPRRLGMSYAELVPALVQALKETDRRVSELEARMDACECGN